MKQTGEWKKKQLPPRYKRTIKHYYGCYDIYWSIKGLSGIKYSSMFPSEWTKLKTVKKIKEAGQNAIYCIEKTDSIVEIVGVTSEGMEIQLIKCIKGPKKGQVLTAYPVRFIDT